MGYAEGYLGASLGLRASLGRGMGVRGEEMAGPATSTTSSSSLPTSSPDSRMMERLVLWRREEGRREGGGDWRPVSAPT